MDRWEWRLRVSTWLSLYKWNESVNLQHKSEEEHRGNRNRSNRQERDGLASPGRRQEANGAEGVPPCTRLGEPLGAEARFNAGSSSDRRRRRGDGTARLARRGTGSGTPAAAVLRRSATRQRDDERDEGLTGRLIKR